MPSKWKRIIGAVAPTLATALYGPMAGSATKAIARGLLGDDSVPESEVARAVENASREDLVKLKQIDADFALEMKRLEIDLAAINAQTVQTEIKTDAEVHKAQLAQSDLYTKRTRPLIARQSWYTGMGYVAAILISQLVPRIPDIAFDVVLLGALLTPALAYSGVRSLDKFTLRKLPQ